MLILKATHIAAHDLGNAVTLELSSRAAARGADYPVTLGIYEGGYRSLLIHRLLLQLVIGKLLSLAATTETLLHPDHCLHDRVPEAHAGDGA